VEERGCWDAVSCHEMTVSARELGVPLAAQKWQKSGQERGFQELALATRNWHTEGGGEGLLGAVVYEKNMAQMRGGDGLP